MKRRSDRMKITEQKKLEDLPNNIISTTLKDSIGNEVRIATDVIGAEAAMFDQLLEGRNTTGTIEMMIELNEYFVNRSQRRYDTEKDAIADNKKIATVFEKNGVDEIFKFNETPGGGDHLKESDAELEEHIKRKPIKVKKHVSGKRHTNR